MGFLQEFTQSYEMDKKSARQRQIAEGRASFRKYCNYINPLFFQEGRNYQDTVCSAMQAMYEKKLLNPETGLPYDILVLNLPPGFGKSYTASLFATWAFGKDQKNQIITISYGQDLAINFSKTVRNYILEQEVTEDKKNFVPKSFFPMLQIKNGDSAADQWALRGNYMSYLGTSFHGKLTGMRGNILMIDDPIKNAEEAVNDKVKEAHWNFYKNTCASRLLPNAMQLIIQTRWATDDLAGLVTKEFPDRCYTIKLPALNEKEESLCEALYPAKDLIQKRNLMDQFIWAANYLQVPIDIKGALYPKLKTYETIKEALFERVIAYVDTADCGTDYLCAVMGGVIGRYGYITDIYFTEEAMEITESELANRLLQNQVRETLIESNNGGRGFARNIEMKLAQIGHGKKCNIQWFHQSKNKKTRILVNAANVMDQILFPFDFERRFPIFAKALKSYQKKGKNMHDDAPDAVTGFVEMINGDVAGKQKPQASPMMAKNLF